MTSQDSLKIPVYRSAADMTTDRLQPLHRYQLSFQQDEDGWNDQSLVFRRREEGGIDAEHLRDGRRGYVNEIGCLGRREEDQFGEVHRALR